MKIRPVGVEFHSDGRTDRHEANSRFFAILRTRLKRPADDGQEINKTLINYAANMYVAGSVCAHGQTRCITGL